MLNLRFHNFLDILPVVEPMSPNFMDAKVETETGLARLDLMGISTNV